ncbi:metallophosphoesterase family protein [Nocardia sp. NPDC057668]|uniref:metallophosphoesterase family protein n=1 Tax=Nocardia sp. NPDC057668 TaxID=3346202 RepID=UPI00366DCBDD
MNALTLIQLSDTHIRADGAQVQHGVDTYANLTRVLDRLRAFGGPIDALLLTGDLADAGDPAAYRRLRSAIEPVAAELGAQVLYVMGNHDERRAFGYELLGRAPGSVPARPHDHVLEVNGLRVIALDSTIPGRHDGDLEPGQLDWLADQLRTPAARGTLLAIHHPPLPSSLAAAKVLGLRNTAELAAVLAGTDVRQIISGHHHLTAASTLAGIPAWIGPAVAYRIEGMAPVGRQQAAAGAGYTRIDLIEDTFVLTAIEVPTAAPLYDRDEAAELRRLAALTPEHG